MRLSCAALGRSEFEAAQIIGKLKDRYISELSLLELDCAEIRQLDIPLNLFLQMKARTRAWREQLAVAPMSAAARRALSSQFSLHARPTSASAAKIQPKKAAASAHPLPPGMMAVNARAPAPASARSPAPAPAPASVAAPAPVPRVAAAAAVASPRLAPAPAPAAAAAVIAVERRAKQEAVQHQQALKREERGGGASPASLARKSPSPQAIAPHVQHLLAEDPPLPSRKSPLADAVDGIAASPNAQPASAASAADASAFDAHAFDWVDLDDYPFSESDADRLQAAICFVQAAARALLARPGGKAAAAPRLSAARRRMVAHAVQRMPLRELGDMAPLGKLGVRAPVCQLLGSLMSKGAAGARVLADWLDQSFRAQNADDLAVVYEYFEIVLTQFCDVDAYADEAEPASASEPARAAAGGSMRVLKKGGDDDDFSMFAGAGRQQGKKQAAAQVQHDEDYDDDDYYDDDDDDPHDFSLKRSSRIAKKVPAARGGKR